MVTTDAERRQSGTAALTPRTSWCSLREDQNHADHRSHLHRQHDRPAARLVLRRVRARPQRRDRRRPVRALPRRHSASTTSISAATPPASSTSSSSGPASPWSSAVIECFFMPSRVRQYNAAQAIYISSQIHATRTPTQSQPSQSLTAPPAAAPSTPPHSTALTAEPQSPTTNSAPRPRYSHRAKEKGSIRSPFLDVSKATERGCNYMPELCFTAAS